MCSISRVSAMTVKFGLIIHVEDSCQKVRFLIDVTII
jgi:hypothetical protein